MTGPRVRIGPEKSACFSGDRVREPRSCEREAAVTEEDTRQDDEQKVDSEEIPRQVDEEEDSEVVDKMKELEENPPEKLEDWPDDQTKYQTFGGPEGHHGYDEGPEQKLGPSSLRHEEGGGVTIEGEEVDDPEEYKGEPIPGGPTDPNAPTDAGEDDDDRSKDERSDDDSDDDESSQ
jgi:hypothetical protein